jgi:S1-C subfamily serine protease
MDYLYISGRFAEVLNFPRDRAGLLVQRVAANSPAGRVGLRGGDIAAIIGGVPILLGGDVILEVVGIKIEGIKTESIRERVKTLQPQDQFTLKVLREGRQVTLNIPYGKLY